ncbi:MAG: restriction endonuclease subunit S [Vibrio ordalii]|uniref:restriction endonuclease subunit S n=1 Tax=Vibrio ordalii TaxID=28174 RepID=UPI003F35B278
MSKTIPAIDYCYSIFDGTHDTPKQSDIGYPLVTSKHMNGDTLNISEAYLISNEDFESINRRSKVSQWDILFSMIGTVGEVYLERSSSINYAIKNIGVFSCKDDKRAEWLYYYLRSPSARKHIQRYLSGAVQKFLSLGALRDFPVLPFDEKASVAVGIVAAIDKKIELNNRINAELEAMAQTLYDYWFVQFDFPDANGKPYKSSCGKMVYNPTLKREIPEGWNWKPVSSIIEVKDGTHDSPKPSDSGQYLITSKHLKPSGIDFYDAYLISQEDFDAVNKRSKVDEGDFLLSMIGTVGLSQWAMKIDTPYAIKNIGLFKTSQAPEMADYIYAAVTSLHGRAYLQQNQSTGTSQPYVTLGTLRSIPILIPNERVFEQFNAKIKPIHKLMYENTAENQKLANLRDWLLPMLMNGQVSVGKAS